MTLNGRFTVRHYRIARYLCSSLASGYGSAACTTADIAVSCQCCTRWTGLYRSCVTECIPRIRPGCFGRVSLCRVAGPVYSVGRHRRPSTRTEQYFNEFRFHSVSMLRAICQSAQLQIAQTYNRVQHMQLAYRRLFASRQH